MSDIAELLDKYGNTSATAGSGLLYLWMVDVTKELTALRAENAKLRAQIETLDSRTIGSVMLG